jgi:hypothetical protein
MIIPPILSCPPTRVYSTMYLYFLFVTSIIPGVYQSGHEHNLSENDFLDWVNKVVKALRRDTKNSPFGP